MGRDHLIRKYRRELLTKLCTFIKVSDVGGQEIKAALADEQFIDFEDGLQYQCAQVTAVDLIITRNTNDFIASEIPVLTPSEFANSI